MSEGDPKVRTIVPQGDGQKRCILSFRLESDWFDFAECNILRRRGKNGVFKAIGLETRAEVVLDHFYTALASFSSNVYNEHTFLQLIPLPHPTPTTLRSQTVNRHPVTGYHSAQRPHRHHGLDFNPEQGRVVGV